MDSFGFVGAFLKAGVINQIVFVLLVIMSVYIWALIIKKHMQLKKAYKTLVEFSNIVTNGDMAVINSYVFAHKNAYSEVLKTIMQSSSQKKDQKDAAKLQSVVILKKIGSSIEEKLDHLATIANAAPFIGLFGTVLGVIASFQQIALSESVSLDVIAPGIAEALYATALGIFVAVPAAVFYNLFNTKLEKLQDAQEDMINQLLYL